MKQIFKLMSITLVSMFLFLTGCKTVPSTETLYATSYSIGVSAALVMNQTTISDKDRNIIIEIMNRVDKAVPTTGVSFTDTWTPIAMEYVGQLVNEGQIDQAEGQIILAGFGTITRAVDYIVYKRYPKVGEDVTYIEAVTHGFCAGFLKYFTPANTFKSTNDKIIYDEEAYNYMINNM